MEREKWNELFIHDLCGFCFAADGSVLSNARKDTRLCAVGGELVFYCSFDLRYLPFLLFTALSTWLASKALEKFGQKRWVLLSCIGANAALWFAIKELPWLVKTAGRIFPVQDLSLLSVIVPVGLSYFILQAIGYLVDVWKGKIRAEKSFWKYLLFLTWFPAIVQGPISRYAQLMPQLLHEKKFCFDHIRDHLLLILIGLVKKMVIADRLGMPFRILIPWTWSWRILRLPSIKSVWSIGN